MIYIFVILAAPVFIYRFSVCFFCLESISFSDVFENQISISLLDAPCFLTAFAAVADGIKIFSFYLRLYFLNTPTLSKTQTSAGFTIPPKKCFQKDISKN